METRHARSGFADINITPLVDVMLVLLAVFMVTAPLLSATLRLELPRERAPASTLPQDAVVATVAADGHIVLDGRDITDDPRSALALHPRLATQGRLYIEGHADARHAAIVRLVAAAQASGVDGVSLLVDPSEAPEDRHGR